MSQFLSFAGFELRYHLRRPVNYVFMAMMFFLGFLFVASDRRCASAASAGRSTSTRRT
jgi:hypothetical protein